MGRPGLKVKIEAKEDAKSKEINEMNQRAKFLTKGKTKRIATGAEKERLVSEWRRAKEEKKAQEEEEAQEKGKAGQDNMRLSRGFLNRCARFDETEQSDSTLNLSVIPSVFLSASAATGTSESSTDGANHDETPAAPLPPPEIAEDAAAAADGATADIATAVATAADGVGAVVRQTSCSFSNRKALVDIASIFVNRKRELTSSPPLETSDILADDACPEAASAADSATAAAEVQGPARDDSFDRLRPDGDVLSGRTWTTQRTTEEAMRGVPRRPRRHLIRRVFDNCSMSPIGFGIALGIILYYVLRMILEIVVRWFS